MTIINKVSNKTLMPGITAIPDVVDAPTIGAATAVDYQSATVAFTAAATGGTATSFTAISTPGSVTGSSATSPITVSGLTDNTSYTFKVYGANSSGTWSAVQSSASGSITTPVATSFESIATTTVGAGGSSTITFSSIPSTYKHLQIRAIVKCNRNVYVDDLGVRFNGDTATNYSFHRLYGFGVNPPGVDAATTISYMNIGQTAGGTVNNALGFGGIVIDILEYANTNINKTVRALSGYDDNGQGAIQLASGNWRSTSAINSITLLPLIGTSINQYSSFALFGIK